MNLEATKAKVKNLLNLVWGMRAEFLKYFVVGISALCLDVLLLVFLKEVLTLDPVRAVMLGQVPIFLFVFLLNKYWSFGDQKTGFIQWQFIKYLIVVGFNYIIGIVTMLVFSQFLEFDYKLVRIGTIALGVSWNFFLYRYWIYR